MERIENEIWIALPNNLFLFHYSYILFTTCLNIFFFYSRPVKSKIESSSKEKKEHGHKIICLGDHNNDHYPRRKKQFKFCSWHLQAYHT